MDSGFLFDKICDSLQEDLSGESLCLIGFYLYIGITSLCLYDSADRVLFQDGILHKNVLCKSFKREKFPFPAEKELTPDPGHGMMNLLRAVVRRPFFIGTVARFAPGPPLSTAPGSNTEGASGRR